MSESPIERLNAALEGRYRIEREVGEGGMATVYLADDLRHERKIALKVLKPELAAVVGAERFLAEIKTTANLHHPHILPLHDSGEADGFLYYVMPFVEGESLRVRLDRERQLPVDEAVRIASAIAAALQHAHERGVIHRDIKPANILLQDGEPLVSDFGIALAVSQAGGGRLTETGLSLGTPYYMSPEQAAADREPTAASDVYSLGCVLYQMLVGEPPHTGSTAQAVLARILTGDVTAPATGRPSIPANVDAAIRRSLERLPADRFTSVQAFAQALADPAFRHGDTAGTLAAGAPRRIWNALTVTLAATSLALAVALGLSLRRPAAPATHVERFAVPFEPGDEPNLLGYAAFDLSPDGTLLVYRQLPVGSAGSIRLMVRRWDELSAAPVRESEGAVNPAVSPDGLELAFELNGEIKVLAFAGGPVRTLTRGYVPEWGPDGFIYAGTDSGVVRVPATGGAVESMSRLAEGDVTQVPYDFLPGGRYALLWVPRQTPEPPEVRTLDLRTGEMKTLAAGTQPRYTRSGRLLYLAGTTLMAAPFDAASAETLGPAVAVVENVAAFSIADDGKLFYSLVPATGDRLQLMWVSREGAATPVEAGWTFDPSPTSGNRSWSLSPDGTRIAVKILTDLGADIWVKQLDNGTLSRLTFYEGEDRFPRWARDGKTVTFLSARGGDLDLWSRPADGTGEAELLVDTDGNLAEGFWSPDGKWVVLRTGGVGGVVGGRDIYGYRPGVDSVPVPLVSTEYDEGGVAISDDGHWMAYQSDETGRREVFVRPFPDVERGKWQVSTGGGRAAVWAHSGREIFYLTDTNEVMVAEVDPGPPFSVGTTRRLFDPGPQYYFMNNTTSYEVTADDQTFLMARTAGDIANARPYVLVNNFFEELKRRVPR